MKELIVIALGGNAISQAGGAGTTEEQLENVDIASGGGDIPVESNSNGNLLGVDAVIRKLSKVKPGHILFHDVKRCK